MDRKRLVELKARYEDHEKARARLAPANSVEVVHQVDTYFAMGERRLKLRVTEGRRDALLVYYERPDDVEPKESEVILLSVPQPESIKEILTRVLGIQVIVRKKREIYRKDGIQIHLDEVEGLGRFLEFELAVDDTPDRIEKGRAQLAAMRRQFEIPDENLVASSYSDLLAD